MLGLVALHRRQFGAVDHHYRAALHYAEVAGDPSLQASALLAASTVAMLYRGDPAGAAPNHERLSELDSQVTPLQRSRLRSSMAIGLAMMARERESLRHLHLAEATFPATPNDDPSFARLDFGPGQLALYQGLAQLALAREFPDRHYQRLASETFDQVGTLSGPSAMAERVRVEIVNHQADTALEMRDLESFVSHLRRGAEGARSLRSALRLHEASTSWRRALQVWPTEPRVTALAELFTEPPGQLTLDSR